MSTRRPDEIQPDCNEQAPQGKSTQPSIQRATEQPTGQTTPKSSEQPSTEKTLSSNEDVGESFGNIVAALNNLIEEQESDPNFPQDLLDRARRWINSSGNKADEDSDDGELERAQSLLGEFREQKDMMLNDSAYPEVRAVVDNTDDPTLPVATFRVFFMGTFFTIGGTAIQQFFSLRLPSISMSTYVVQLLSMPLGVLMARWLPKRQFNVFGWRFSLNPGRFNQKEHILISMMANVAFGGNSSGAYVVTVIQVLKLDRFFGEKVLSNSLGWQITTLLATQLMGYGCAGMARRFLVYPASMIWQRPLSNIALTKALHRDDGDESKASVSSASAGAGRWTMSRYRFFLISFVAMFVYFWIPNYLFEALALFNWPTWISPGNVTLALIAGSTCGLGLNPLPTLDWNVVSYLTDPIITPLFTILNLAAGMALIGFIAVPIAYFNNVRDGAYLPINSNRIFDNTGAYYNVSRVLADDLTLNATAYAEYGVPLMATTQLLSTASYFSIFGALPTYVFLWHRKDIARGLRSAWRRTSRDEEFGDVHNRLMAAYRECPHWWYLAILVVALALACASVRVWDTGTPVWAIFLALAFTAVLQIPVGMLYAVSNLEVPTSILSMVLGGYLLEGRVLPNMVFKMFSYMSTSQSLNFVSDLKLAHYAKIPPRWAFAAQIYATVLAAFVGLGVNHWVLRNVEGLCAEDQPDRFTCPHTHNFFRTSVLWGAISPRRLYGPGAPYAVVTYFIPLGALLPVLVYYAKRRWPASLWRSVHIPIFLAGPFPWGTYNWAYLQGAVVLAVYFNYYVKRRWAGWWERYAYVLTSSFSAAIGVVALVIFFALQHHQIVLDWWGNRVMRQGVDMGGFVRDGHKVRCSYLPIPHKGYFDIGFKWRT